jgi:hypothetical protein
MLLNIAELPIRVGFSIIFAFVRSEEGKVLYSAPNAKRTSLQPKRDIDYNVECSVYVIDMNFSLFFC